jgi:hypothetical protein
MTALAIAIAAAILTTLAVAEIRRANRRLPFFTTPSPCERDAQDGRGDLREGAGAGGRHSGSNYIQEPINHA